MSYLCILDINLLLVTSYFLLFCGLSFCSVDGFLCCAKLFNFCFYLFWPRRQIQKNIALIYVKVSSTCVLFWDFYPFWCHTQIFKPYRVYLYKNCVRKCSNLIISHSIQFCQHQLLKKLSFPHCAFFPSLPWIEHRCVVSFLDYLLCFIYLCVCFCAKTMLFHYFVILNLGWLFLKLCSFSSKLVWQFRILVFHMSFRIIYSTSVENVLGIFIGIALNLQIPLGSKDF